MKKTALVVSTFCAVILISGVCAKLAPNDTPDPNDPLNKPALQCNDFDTAGTLVPGTKTSDFCGTTAVSSTQNDSCFEKVTVTGCNIMKEPSCLWGFIYTYGVSRQTPEALCSNEQRWCSKQGYSDCTTDYNTCLQYNKTFQNVCMKTA